MRILALTFGDENTPSTLFRLHQYLELFAAEGVTFDFAVAKEFDDYSAIDGYDVVLLELAMISTAKVARIRKRARVLIYDACDRIWLRPGKEYDWLTRYRQERRRRAIARAADMCIVANGVIGKDLEEAGARRIERLPMAVDPRVWNDRGRPRPDGTVTIGWSGSPGNLAFLEPLAPTLRRLVADYEQVRVAVHCGRKPRLDGVEFVYHPFEPGKEADAVRTFDIGLVPLPDDPFVRGKFPIKPLQYFACGAAVVGEGVGATAELLEHEVDALTVTAERDWESSLRRLVEDASLRERLTVAGKAKVEREYALTVVFRRFLSLLCPATAQVPTATLPRRPAPSS